jgi:iron complex transport system substrate-binding protein
VSHPLRSPGRAALALAGGLLATTVLATTTPLPAAAGAGNPARYPVTVDNCGTPLTFPRAPTRAVSNDINMTEDMLALGLGSHMVADFGVNGDGPEGHPVPARYAGAFRHVRDASPDYFTLEELVGLHPDFLFAGWDYGLQPGTRLTPAGLATFGIKTLVLTESCAQVDHAATTAGLGDTYQDLRNLGAVFGVEGRADRLVAALQHQVAAVRARVAGLRPVTVFDYDSGKAAPFTAPGLTTLNALITAAGGKNIFAGLRQSWTSVSWEDVVAADPACIIVNDYGRPTAAQKIAYLRSNPVTEHLAAVRHGCILALSYDEVTPGPRNAQAVTAIAHLLHPGAFGLPPTGS